VDNSTPHNLNNNLAPKTYTNAPDIEMGHFTVWSRHF